MVNDSYLGNSVKPRPINNPPQCEKLFQQVSYNPPKDRIHSKLCWHCGENECTSHLNIWCARCYKILSERDRNIDLIPLGQDFADINQGKVKLKYLTIGDEKQVVYENF